MTNETRPIAKCPYCDCDGGIIALSITALPKYFRRSKKSWDLYEEPAQSLLVFNGPTGDQQPCPHLLGIHGECALTESKSGRWIDRFDFCWWHLQMESPTTDFVFHQVLHDALPDHLKGDIPVQEINFTPCWSADGDGHWGKHWLIEGYAFFCPDFLGLVESAPALMEVWQTWVNAHPELSAPA